MAGRILERLGIRPPLPEPPLAVPGREPGTVYIPSLGKTFQQVELMDKSWVIVGGKENGARRLLGEGAEAVLIALSLFMVKEHSDAMTECYINRRQAWSLSTYLLECATRGAPDLAGLLARADRPPITEEEWADFVIGYQSRLKGGQGLPWAFQLYIPQQLRWDDDTRFTGIPKDARLIIQGIEKHPLR